MTTNTTKAIFLVSLLSTIVGGYLYLEDVPGSPTLLTIGVLSQLVFTIWALYEIWSKSNLVQLDKIVWTAAFVVLNGIAGIFFYFVYRDKMVD
ncbi:MAG: hypothetical protein KDC28_08155 [Saprospiraceae bacterium]|nr:hypothetical protein [Saprospiraceae bacterium]MCB9320522.1 hypothetical protein [Lewinellaceae bacterium]